MIAPRAPTKRWLLPLASLDDPALLPSRLLEALGLFEVEAAQVVCLDEPDLREELLDRLEALVNQSLIVQHPMEEDATVQEPFGRFSLLEIVQRYALARLSESGQMQQVQQRHAQYYLALVESSEPDLYVCNLFPS